MPDSNKRPTLQQLLDRLALTKDENRPQAVAKRRKKGQRTARENIADLCDDESFVEYGALAIAAQRSRRTLEDLQQNTPADGLVMGVGRINSQWFGEEETQCVVLSYDYTVLAGTQGVMNHKKLDRMLDVTHKLLCPIVFFVEGGGGRPGDVDVSLLNTSGLDVPSFARFASLSGKVPRIAIVSGYCFAGNAALAGMADVIIATQDSSLGMGGPAMIEGGGLGKFHPKEVGPAPTQAANGVIDVLVKNEADAVQVAKQYLGYFQGRIAFQDCADQLQLRTCIPENRRFAYDVYNIVHTLADTNSVLELRAAFARNLVTALIRIGGRPVGLIANNPRHLGGAIDSNAADKAARFMQLCDAYGLPIVSLCDTPGFMVGPDHERTGLVRHTSRMFVTAASLQVPILTIVTRRGYGLGAMAMSGGSFHASACTVSWDSGEFGPMNLEGAVRLGFRKELEALADEDERKALYQTLLQEYYERSKAIAVASQVEVDEVIDPADTRKWVISLLQAIPPMKGNGRFIDCW